MKLPRKVINPIKETFPAEWRSKFLSYKDLKKMLKSIAPMASAETRTEARAGMMDNEIDFFRLLEEEMEKLNSFFVEKEEEFIIQMKILQERIAKAKDSKSNEDMLKEIKKEVEDLHERMAMLEKFSALNYTGLAKIIKKYDRRTGALIRLPSIQSQRMLQQPPFVNTDLLHKLVGECEAMLDGLFPKHVTEDQDPSSLVGKVADRPNKPGKECPDPTVASIPSLPRPRPINSI